MKKLLGLIFNRWTLTAVLLLAALLVVWIVGPLFAIGEWRPLDSERSRWITTAVLVLIVVAMAFWSLWRARRGNARVVDQLVAASPPQASESADMAAVRQRFEEALVTLKNARFGPQKQGGLKGLAGRLSGRYLYELPWYVIVGAPGSGKTTALRNSGLKFPLADRMGEQAVRGVGGTRNCDWWFTDQAVLIDTAGRFTTQDSDQATDSASWGGFLDMLKRARPRQPLNGVLVTVSVSDLLTRTPTERQRYAATVRQRVQELHERLSIRFPIYLLVTKCDLLAGFMDNFGPLDKDQRAAPWGFTFPIAADGKARGPALETFQAEFDALLQRLSDGLIDRLQAESDPQRRARIYAFPGQFAGLRSMLQEFTEAVFSPSSFEAEPMLRGVYFVSGTQEGTPIDRMLGSIARHYQLERAILPPQQSSGKSYFLSRLLGEVVFAEHGLAGTNRKWERSRNAMSMAGYAVLGVAAVGTLTAWTVSYRNNLRYVEGVGAKVDAVRKLVQETENRALPDLLPIVGALDATRGLANAGSGIEEGQVPWSLGFGLFQGKKLDGAVQSVYRRMLVDAMLPRLALRAAEQLRSGAQPESEYEALKVYLMMYDPAHFDDKALKTYFEADWDVRLGAEMTTERRDRLSQHLDSLLAQGSAVSPLPIEQSLVDTARNRLAAVPLPQRVYNRLRLTGLGKDYKDFTIAEAGGGNVGLVFQRASGRGLTQGVSGLFTYNGYHKGFQPVVGDVTKQLADEQEWVLGIKAQGGKPGELLASERLIDDVRRLYLNDYATVWGDFIGDIRVIPPKSATEAARVAQVLSAPDTPMVPLFKAMSRETTLLAGNTLSNVKASVIDKVRTEGGKLLGSTGAVPANPGVRIESIVDDRFAGLRRLVTAPEGGKAPIDGMVARLAELQLHLNAVDIAGKSGSPPPANPIVNVVKTEASGSPEPLRSLLTTLVSNAENSAMGQLRETLGRDVRALVGTFCQEAIAGRYPFDRGATREVTPADFAAIFGPGGKMDQAMQKLEPYVDKSTQTWSFRPVNGTPLGLDSGWLPQFQRAQIIKETFFPAGAATPSLRLEFKPIEMDQAIAQFTLDVDGQIVKYAHGPQIPTPVQWPGTRGSNVVRLLLTPGGSGGMVMDGPWALFRMFDRVNLQPVPGASADKFRALFDLEGRKAQFDINASSVRNPFRLEALQAFRCPTGL